MSDTDAGGDTAAAADPPWTPAMPEQPSEWTARSIYALGFLTLISSFNYLDRSLLGLVLPLIKQEMNLSDTVLGLVSGLAFVLFYSLLGMPIAWLADRRSRRNIIGIGFMFWSLMTMVTGFVTNVWQLATARFLMGAGEASCLSPSHSMLSDLFGKTRRPMALSIIRTGAPISFVAFYPIAGWISDTYGWREAFLVAGTAGLVLAAIFFLTVREPQRGGRDGGAGSTDNVTLAETARFLAGSRTYLLLLVAGAFAGANIYAIGTWSSTFLVRVHGLSLTEIGALVGPVRGILSAVGVLTGGVLATRLVHRDPRWLLWVPALAALAHTPAEALFFLGESMPLWLAGMIGSSFFGAMSQGPMFAACLNIARPRMRALATSLMITLTALIGEIFGPLLVGAISDALTLEYGRLAIRYAMLVLVLFPLAGSIIYAVAARHVEADTDRAHQG